MLASHNSQDMPTDKAATAGYEPDVHRDPLARPGKSLFAARKTASGVNPVMHSWCPSGQTGFWQGPQGTGWSRCTAPGWLVRVQAMCVGPKSEITGTPNAAAKCRGPESVVIINAERFTDAFVSPRLIA